MHLILILAVTGVLLFGAALGLLSFAAANPPPVRTDSGAVIVLGCQVYSTGNGAAPSGRAGYLPGASPADGCLRRAG